MMLYKVTCTKVIIMKPDRKQLRLYLLTDADFVGLSMAKDKHDQCEK